MPFAFIGYLEVTRKEAMGANLYWEPVERRKNDLNVGAPQKFMEEIERVFGSKCPKLNDECIVRLETMRDLTTSAEFKGVYQELIDAIQKVGAIKISAEY